MPDLLTLSSIRQLYADKGTEGLITLYESIFDSLSTSPACDAFTTTSSDDIETLRSTAMQNLQQNSPTLPLYGVPYSVKDNIDVTDLPTLCGTTPSSTTSPLLTPASESAAIVQQLQAMGAILIGKTTLDGFATGLTGTRAASGVVRCVHDAEYIGGGSSSGAGASVALGKVVFALGTDTAGSGRVPAVMQGIVGLKPSRGLISVAGVVPACKSLDCVAVLAGSVQDASAVFELIKKDTTEKYDGMVIDDHWLRRPERREGECRRVFIPSGKYLKLNDDKSKRYFDAAVRTLRTIGLETIQNEDLFKPLAECAQMLYGSSFVAERYSSVGPLVETLAPDSEVNATVRSTILSSKSLTASQAYGDLDALQRLRAQAKEGVWKAADVIMVPSVPGVFKVEEVEREPVETNKDLGTYTNFVNLMDLCAIAVPVGMKEGADGEEEEDKVPRGVTFIGEAFEDGLIASIAERFVKGCESIE